MNNFYYQFKDFIIKLFYKREYMVGMSLHVTNLDLSQFRQKSKTNHYLVWNMPHNVLL